MGPRTVRIRLTLPGALWESCVRWLKSTVSESLGVAGRKAEEGDPTYGGDPSAVVGPRGARASGFGHPPGRVLEQPHKGG